MIKAYLWLEKFVPGLIFIAIFIAMLLEIGSRAIFGTSFAWNTEFCRYALVWVAFLGSVYVRRERAHIQVVFLHEYLVRNNHRTLLFLVNFIRSAAATFFWIFIAYFGYRLSTRTVRFYSSAMGISQYWLYFSTVVCGILAGIMEIINFIRLFLGTYQEPVKSGSADQADGKAE
ncbi:MAG: TRAP transporter small permease, partial [Planctomycetota bacterium]|nr:TRAP transporter small permease [Planctomycetota bacterium]